MAEGWVQSMVWRSGCRWLRKPAGQCRRAGLRARFGRLRRDERGAALVEFGLLAWPFFALLLAVVEVSLMLLHTSTLETAVNNVAREIRVGIAANQTDEAAYIDSRLCDQLLLRSNCNELFVEIRNLGNDLSANIATSVDLTFTSYDTDGDGQLSSTEMDTAIGALPSEPSTGGSYMLVRAYSRYQLIIPMVAPLLGGSDGEVVLMSTAIFRTEPF